MSVFLQKQKSNSAFLRIRFDFRREISSEAEDSKIAFALSLREFASEFKFDTSFFHPQCFESDFFVLSVVASFAFI